MKTLDELIEKVDIGNRSSHGNGLQLLDLQWKVDALTERLDAVDIGIGKAFAGLNVAWNKRVEQWNAVESKIDKWELRLGDLGRSLDLIARPTPRRSGRKRK